MNPIARSLLVLGIFCLHISLGNATETTPPRPIPFKTEPASIEEQGSHAALVLTGLLLVTGIALYVVRKRMPKLVGMETGSRLKVVERNRLNPRCTLYLIQLDHRELLVAQCGDRLLQLDPNQAIPSTGSSSELRDA